MMIKNKKNGCGLILLQFFGGLILLTHGVYSIFFSTQVVRFDMKYFQPNIGPGALTFILGVALIIGSFIKLKERKVK